MPVTDQELAWAKALQKSKNRAVHEQDIDWGLKKAALFQDMLQAKKNLKMAIDSRDTDTAVNLTKTLIDLRAEQLACDIAQYNERTEQKDPAFVEGLTFAYKKECAALVKAVAQLAS